MNNITEYQQKEIYTDIELREIADKIVEELEKELNEYYIRAKAEYGTITIQLGTKFFEISEFVQSMVENEISENAEFEDLSEEEIDDYFEERFNDVLEDIDGENAVYVNGKIETQKYVVEFSPLECENDYCIAGLEVEIQFKDKIDNIDIENLANLIITVFRL